MLLGPLPIWEPRAGAVRLAEAVEHGGVEGEEADLGAVGAVVAGLGLERRQVVDGPPEPGGQRAVGPWLIRGIA